MSEKQTEKNLKLNLKSELFPLLIIFSAILISALSYNQLPEQVVSHWNMNGEANGWSSRNFHTIFFPALLVFIYLLMNTLPKIDPNKKRYAEFKQVYLSLRDVIILSLLVIFAGATLSNLGYAVNIGSLTSITIGFMFIILGNYLGKLKRNWFVGIKTPWTISSENSWNKTHRLGGKLFVALGLITMLLPLFSTQAAFWFLIGGSLGILPIVTIYSYVIYRKDKDRLK